MVRAGLTLVVSLLAGPLFERPLSLLDRLETLLGCVEPLRKLVAADFAEQSIFLSVVRLYLVEVLTVS